MPYKLIVADNSVTVQKAIQLAFSGPEFEVYPFEDGEAVVKSLSQIKPDVVLLSLSLASKDGYEVSAYLRSQEEFNQTSLILFRGAFEAVDQEKLSRFSYDEMIQKPFDSEKLVQLVKDTIDKRKGPVTFPEEPILDEIPLTKNELDSGKDSLQEESLSISSLPDNLSGIEKIVRGLVKKEILEVERELEKRIRAQIRSELKNLRETEMNEK
jgi:DNA-binding response OmpR family regulator